jgi:hypothetical protein
MISSGSYDKLAFNCTKNASYSVNKSESQYNNPEYEINLNVSGIKDGKQYVIFMEYSLPDFIFDEGRNQIAMFSSSCSFQSCAQSWIRYITLPSKNSIIQDLSGNINILGKYPDGPWLLQTTGTETFFIRYYDSWQVDFLTPLNIGIITGIITGVLVALFVPSLKDIKKFIQQKNKPEN